MYEIVMPEPMTRFQCNLQGCCCEGWGITFDVPGALHMADSFPEERRIRILTGARLIRHGGKVYGVDLARVGPERRCQFLRADKLCEVHATQGVDALPQLCVTFPAFAFARLGRGQLTWDAICPEVLERLDESDDPYEIATVQVEPGTELDRRSRRGRAVPPMRLAGRELEPATLLRFEDEIMETLADTRLPALDQLGRVTLGVARAFDGDEPGPLRLPETPPAAFDAFFDDCVAAHGPRLLANHLESYKRFVFALPLADVDWSTLPPSLEFDPRWRERVDPRSPELQPLIRRYLAHRFFSPFDRSPATGHAVFSYGAITHTLGTAFRYLVALTRWLDVPADRRALKVALGAAEYVSRGNQIPPAAMPWFGLEPDPSDPALALDLVPLDGVAAR